jgi:predicted transcriptional regulator
MTSTLDHVLTAIADPTRRAILARLTRGPARVTDVAEPFAMSLAAVSKHVRMLERAGLVRRVRRGASTRSHSTRGRSGKLCGGRRA